MIERREAVFAFVLGALLAIAMHWPLAANLGSHVLQSYDDPLHRSWELAWLGHALLEQPRDLFQANHSWPLPNSLAFSDAMVGYAPLAVPGEGAVAALVRHNVLFLFSYALAFFGAFLLAREAGAGRAGAVVGGAAFGFAPWRIAHESHLHVLSSGAIPLSLFLLARGYRRRRPWLVALGWIAATWQLTLGFTLGLQLVYLLAAISVVAAVVWLRRRTPPARPLVIATLAGAALLVAVAAVQAQPYLAVADEHEAAQRSAFEVSSHSPVPQSFLAAPEENLVWGAVTAPLRKSLRSGEQMLFLGLATVTLAALGLAAPVLSRRLRMGLALAATAFAGLSLGFHTSAGRLSYLFPYRLLYEFAPGWEGVRTPGRITTLTSLALALLAAAGTHHLGTLLADRAPGSLRRWIPVAAATTAFLLVLVEGFGRVPLLRVPNVPPGQLGVPEPQLHLPVFANDSLYLYWSVEGFPAIANYVSGFPIESQEELNRVVHGFPDVRSVRRLRGVGVRAVVVHPRLAEGRERDLAGDRLARLGLVQERQGSVIIYHLTPGTS